MPLLVPNFEVCDETHLCQKHPKTQNHLHFPSFSSFWVQLFRKTAISFILRMKTKHHLVQHMTPVWMIYVLSRDNKNGCQVFWNGFCFQKKKTFYFFASYRSSSLSQGKTFYMILELGFASCIKIVCMAWHAASAHLQRCLHKLLRVISF